MKTSVAWVYSGGVKVLSCVHLFVRKLKDLISKEVHFEEELIPHSGFNIEKLMTIAPDPSLVSVDLFATNDHVLDIYLGRYTYFDRRLPMLAKILQEYYPDSEIIDVGANIGDTACLIRQYGCKLRIHAIEPSTIFHELLLKNISKNPHILNEIVPIKAFIGKKGSLINLSEGKGTARPVNVENKLVNEQDIPVITFEYFSNNVISLIKTDTDGYDAKILLNNIEYIAKNRPIIWAETDVISKESLDEWLASLDSPLVLSSYEKVVVFDNFGFTVDLGNILDLKDTLIALLKYIHRCHLAGHCTIYYFDICLFPKEKLLVFDRFVTSIDELNIGK